MKYILLALICMSSLSAWSQVKHIVFNVEGTIVKQIPIRNFNAFVNKKDMITVNADNKVRYYYIYPYAVTLIQYLQNNPNYVVHFMSHQSRAWLDGVLKLLPLTNGASGSVFDLIEGGVNKVLSGENIKDGKFNLRLVSSDLNNTLFVTSFRDLLPLEQKRNEFNVGKDFFFYEKWTEVQAELAKNESAVLPNLPKTEDEWMTEQNKMSFVFQALVDAKALTTKDLATAVSKLTIDQPKMTKQGLQVAPYNFAEKITLFKFNSDGSKVTGCGIYHTINKAFIQDKGIDDCLKLHKQKYTFRFDEKALEAVACEMRDEKTGAYIVETKAMAKCLETYGDKVAYHWDGVKTGTCHAYVGNKFVQAASKTSCYDTHVICTALPVKQCTVVEAFEGMENKSIAEILAYTWIPRPTFSLITRNPPPEVYDNVPLPRVQRTLYRSHDPAYYPKTAALQAMLGNPYKGLRSKRTYELEQSFVRNGKSEKEALQSAIKQTDTEFTPTKIDNLINQKSSSYEQWPTHVMYFSAYMPVAFSYNRGLVVAIDPVKSGPLDLNYYSYANGYDWRNGCGGGVDAGEVLLPNYVSPDEISGIYNGSGSTTSTLSISEAYVKIKENGRPMVLDLNSQGRECVMKDKATNKIKFCSQNFNYSLLWPQLPIMNDTDVPVCGIYVVCDDRSPTSCGITDEMRNRYQYKDCGRGAPIPPKSLEWGSKQVQYFSGKELL